MWRSLVPTSTRYRPLTSAQWRAALFQLMSDAARSEEDEPVFRAFFAELGALCGRTVEGPAVA
jgi:hypothetical protein